MASVNATVTQNEAVYTKVEVDRAREAHEFLRTSGYPLQDEAWHMLSDGNIYGVPHLTTADVQRAYDIYGTPVGYAREKIRKGKDD